MTESREEFHDRILAAQDDDDADEFLREPRAPKNPYRVAILAIWITFVSLGLILLVIGSSLSDAPIPGDNGFSETVNGWFLLKVGFVICVVWLFVDLVLWKPTAPLPAAAPLDDLSDQAEVSTPRAS
jgi:hypothetical protein